MKIKNYLFFCLSCFFTVSIGQAQIPPTVEWSETFGGTSVEEPFAMRYTADGGYIVAGYTDSGDGDIGDPAVQSDGWVVKLDADGGLEWEQTYGGSGDDTIFDIRQTADGGYIVAGEKKQGLFGDVWVAKLNFDGSLAWEETYGGSGEDIAYAIQHTNDGGYVLVGSTNSDDGDVGENQGTHDVWVLKLDASGDLDWEETYGGSNEERGAGIQQTTDGGYIVTGYSRSSNGDVDGNQGNKDIWIFKIDGDGDMYWGETYGGSMSDVPGFFPGTTREIGHDCIQQTADGGYIVIGHTYSNDGDIGDTYGLDVWVLKLADDGLLEWEETYGGSHGDYGLSIQETLDGNYIIGANARSEDGDLEFNQGDDNYGLEDEYWLFKIDPLGNILWEETYGGTNADIPFSVQQVSGCEYVMAGYTWSDNGDVGPNDVDDFSVDLFWVLKVQIELEPPAVPNPQSFCWSEAPVLGDLQFQGSNTVEGFPPTYTWYDDEEKTTVLSDSNLLLEDGEDYYVSETIDGCESPLAEIEVVIIPDTPPTGNTPQGFCEGEAATLADLEVTGENLSWYGDAGGTNVLSSGTAVQDGQTYYVSQTTAGCESSLLPVEVRVNPVPEAFDPPPLTACDASGMAEFHLPDLDAAITGGDPNLSVGYHTSLSDAEDNLAPLPGDWTNTEAFSQILYARATDGTTGCHAIVEVDLLVSPTPEIAGADDLSGCDDGNGEAVFNLAQNDAVIFGNQNTANLKITYHENQPDADSGDNAIADPKNYTSAGEIIFVRLGNTQTGCFDTGSFAISVVPGPNIANISIQEEFCSDLPGGNFATIDLTAYDDQINPGNPAGTEVVYYAPGENDPIENPENYTTTSNPQTIIAEVIDIATGCPSAGHVEITISINSRPEVDLSQYNGRALCWDSDLSTPVEGGNDENIILETGLDAAAYTFTWTLDGVELSETSPNLEVTEPGSYEVTVTDTDGASTTCSDSSTVTIIEANPPEFQLDRTTEVIANGHALWVVNVTGTGNYEFRLDDGPWIPLGGEDTLLFEEVAPGFHTVYGRSREGCGMTMHNITLIGYPKFFTPNTDGHNDRWNIIGLENQFQAKILIFDRYGKLLTSLNPADPGWDGTYNGKRMPSNDYWFRVDFMETLADGTERPQVFKAHFTLKR